jgi:hypothetical protein
MSADRPDSALARNVNGSIQLHADRPVMQKGDSPLRGGPSGLALLAVRRAA